MRKAFLILVTMLFGILTSAFAQSANDTVAVEMNKYYYHGSGVELNFGLASDGVGLALSF